MTNKLHTYLLFFLLLILTKTGLSQFYTTGNTPWITKYHTLKTDAYQLIFPAESDSFAIRFAATLDTISSPTLRPYQVKQQRIPILMNNQSVLSNGFVVWAPKRMEIVTTAPQNNFTLPWSDELALHEYRHVAQLLSLNRGFTRIAGYPFGQIAVGGAAGILPLWFFEGDAVYNETVLSNAGRGRSGDFLKDFYSLERAGIRYSYDKAYMGSYKDYIPDYYHLGYHMVRHVNHYYGEETWDRVTLNVAKRSYTIVPFYRGLKKNIGMSKVELYQQTMDSLRKEITRDENTSTETQHEMFTSYKALAIHAADTIYALKTSLDAIPEILRIVDSVETRIHLPGYVTSTRLAASKTHLAWTEVTYDPRWEKRSFNVVKLLDLNAGKVVPLKKKARHFSPSFSQKGDKIVVVQQALDHQFSICIFDIATREQLQELFPPVSLNLKYPVFIDDASLLVLGMDRNGTSFWMVDKSTNQWQQITEPVFDDMENPVVQNNKVYYQCDYDGTMNIYSMDLTTMSINRITNDINGAYYPAIGENNNVLFYSSYTINGFKINSAPIAEVELGVSIDKIQKAAYPFIEKHAEEKNFNLSEIELTTKNYIIEPYRKALGGIAPHSWLPFYADVDALLAGSISEIPVYPGGSLFIQNNLETVYGQVSYYYKQGYHHIQPKLTFAGLYPVITISYDVMGSDYQDLKEQITSSPFDHEGNYNLTVGASVPLSFQMNSWNLYIQPSAKYYRYSYAFNSQFSMDSLPNTSKYGIGLLDFYLYQKRSHRDIYPRWGWRVTAQYAEPIRNKVARNQSFLYSKFYVPSFVKHHSLGASVSYANVYRSSLFPRGLYDIKYNDVRTNVAFKFDYLFPFAYPEWSIGPLVYIKRFSLDIFYDHAVFKYKGSTYAFDSFMNTVGVSLRTDANFLRFYAPFAITNQFSYNIQQGYFYAGFGMSYSL